MKKYSQDDRRIEIRVGESFAIDIEAIPTTGYQWGIKVDGDAAVLNNRELTRGSNAIGASGVERFVFKGKEPGTATLRFALARSWERTAIKTHDVQVEVTKG